MGVSRRDLLAAGGMAALGSLPLLAEASPRRRRTLRIAHITDLHVQPERGAALGMERCLEHAQSQKPDLIVMGGDQVMDALVADRDRVKKQWDVYTGVLSANIATPVVHMLGNHDVFGWGARDRFKSESGFGKAMALDRMEMSKSYGSIDRGGWHIVTLDSVYPSNANGYIGKLNGEQFEWLADDLNKVPVNRPVLIVSHIPILSAAAFFHGHNERTGNWHIPGAWMHIDARKLKGLFAQHPNVKACVAGHIHLLDEIQYQGVKYIGNGAACGCWWGGCFQGVSAGYGLIDLYNDGTVDNRYVSYGWKPMA